MNVQSALNAYKETNLSEIEDATPHRLIELTFQDLKKNLLLIRSKLDQNQKIGGLEAAKSVAAIEILKTRVLIMGMCFIIFRFICNTSS